MEGNGIIKFLLRKMLKYKQHFYIIFYIYKNINNFLLNKCM